MLLSAQNILKEYGIQSVLNVKKIEIREGDRIGLVGRNGSGKSTLLKILSGQNKPDDGVVKRYCEIACIGQDGESDGEADELHISRMHLRESAGESGGERTRRAIAAAFSKHAPLLFADEPTTSLDAAGIRELESMLFSYHGAVVLISHDRALLDDVCTQIWEIEDGDIRVFPGNYSDWYEQRSREREYQQFEYDQYRQKKKNLEKSIGEVRQQAGKMQKPPKQMGHSEWMLYKGTATVQQNHVQKRGKAMMSRLEQMEKKERPKEMPEVSLKMSDSKKIKGKNAARFTGLSFSYEKCRPVLKNVICDIPAGKRTFLVGENGSGKSTMLTCLHNRMEGTFLTGEASVGYFSQNYNLLDAKKTVLENVRETAVVPEHICRAVLINLYLNQNDLDKKAEVLSGGERVKTALAKVLVSGCNFLILDEPTNHMDIYTMEGLERLLEDFDGTLLAVSHDRRFVENLSDLVYCLKDGQIQKIAD